MVSIDVLIKQVRKNIGVMQRKREKDLEMYE